MIKRQSGAAVAVVILLAIGAHVHGAELINFQFDGARTDADTHVTSTGPTFTGNGVLREDQSINNNPNVGAPSGTWNAITFSSTLAPSQTSGFVDAQGQSVPATISFSNLVGQDSCSNCGDAAPGASVGNQALLNDYLGTLTGSPAVTVTIANLPRSFYDVIIYGTNGGSSAGGNFSINGSAFQATNGVGTSPFTQYVQGQDYVEFKNVLTDASGNLLITAGPSTINIGIINGVQLLAVPEPATLPLWGIGSIAAVFAATRGRRRAMHRANVE